MSILKSSDSQEETQDHNCTVFVIPLLHLQTQRLNHLQVGWGLHSQLVEHQIKYAMQTNNNFVLLHFYVLYAVSSCTI